MDSKKFSSHPNSNLESQVQTLVEPNRSTSNRLVSSHLIPPVTTNRTQHDTSTDELNKNISSDYQEIQIRTLTKWINVQLSQVDESIHSIDKDLKDGKKLLKLLAVVSKNPSLKPERGSMRIHQLSNVAQALKYLQDQWGADSLPAIAGEAIVNGDVKSTLAITFFIMLKYQIHPILLNNPDLNVPKQDNLKVPPPSPLPSVSASRSGGKPMAEAKLALLYWVRTQLQDYIQNHIISTIQDFSRSWRSGLAFCLLIHRHDPDLIPTLFTEHIEHASEKETWHTLLSLAFDIAEQHLNIPKYLEPEDLIQVEYPHEPSVMMYISEMYKKMSFKQDLKVEKRLNDISLVSNEIISNEESNEESLISNEESLQVNNMTPTSEEDDEELLPSTPQPELLINDNEDVYQQLETLSSLLNSSSKKEIEQQLKDNKKSRLLLDQAQHIINKLDSTSTEKQVLFSRYNQLKSEWELLSKKLEQNQIQQKKSIHPLDGTTDLIDDNSSNELFKRGITFNQITIAINEELNIIQNLLSNGVKEDELIQSLEQRIHIVNTSIGGIKDEFKSDLLIYDTNDNYFERFINVIDEIEDKYDIVRDWVDQVRSWFIEAERIRNWIDKQIQIIQERNNLDDFNPIDQEILINDIQVIQLHEQHEKLKQEIDHFDSDDMNRLRNHVKSLTTSTDKEDITPADTSTIEITLTTLNKLNHLTLLLSKRSQFIDLLILRIKWENLFSNAVQWIAKTDYELDGFLKEKARWSEKEDDTEEENGIENVIKTLVTLERKISDFDHGDYSNVLDAYQEMESLFNNNLPNYLELRQLGFEKAFEDLMKRSGFSRKVVEQLLSVINTINKFKELRDIGERLRYHLLQQDKNNEEEDIYTEKVQLFKEESAKLITNAETSIPYPNVPEMSTAIGANDVIDNQITNENIRSTISAYIMSLALIADGLDQLLMSRYQIMSLQQRTQEAYDSMKRVQSWMEERIKLLLKSRLDIMLYSNPNDSNGNNNNVSISSKTNSSSNTTMNNNNSNNMMMILDEENFHRLEKERDNIASRLEQMENDELFKLFETVRILEYDVDASNAVSIDRNHLINGIESLESTLQQLKDLLLNQSLELDVLKKRMDWEIQWSKSNSHLHTIGRKLSDFNIKKARYDPSKENVDKPSYLNDNENMQSLQFIQDRVNELGDRHILTLEEFYQEMIESYHFLKNCVPEFITTKQFDLKSEYDDLKLLSNYTLDLMTQRSTITEFLLRCQDAQHEGEKIKEVVLKKTRRIMIKEENENSLNEHIDLFKQELKSIWEDCGKNMLYPVYNGNWLRNPSSTNDNAGLYRSQVRVQIKSLLDKKMEELSILEKSIDNLLQSYYEADKMKSLVTQYEKEAYELSKWIHEQIELLKSQHIDVSAESFLSREMNISDLKKSRLDLYLNVESFESTKVKILHDQIAKLVEDSVEKKKNQSVDVSCAARNLGEVMDHLSQLKRGLSDQAITLEAATMRSEWENSLQLGINRLEEMNDELREFTIKKNQWISQDDLTEEHVNILQQDLNRLISKKNKFEKSILPGIQLNYDNFVEYFPKLSRPIATPDHLEARMESLGRTCSRFQENVSTRSKELDLIKKRIRWEDIVKQALNFLYQQEVKIENFIEEKARWNINLIEQDQKNDEDDDESKLRNELSILYQDFKSYQDDFILPLIQKKFDLLIIENNDQYNGGNILPNSFMKKMQDIKLAQDRTSYYLDFSNQVVTQRCLVAAFILRTAQLEQSAELIREEFITTKANQGTAHIVGLLEDHTNRLEKFKSSIDDVRQHLATSIPYPIRSLENISTQAKLKDETTNSVIQETIELRNTRLNEICSSLQQLLESKERVSRRRLSLHSYKKQAQVAEAWIDTRHEILNRSNSITVKKDSVIDLEKLKEAVTQADSVEQAMKSNENVFTSLNNTFDKCINAFGDKSLDGEEEEIQDELVNEIEEIVEPTHKRLSQAWNTLLIEAAETTKTTTALLIENKIQNWLTCLDALLNQVSSNNDNDNDNQLSIWIDELDKLENQEYQNLTVDVEANKHLLNEEQLTQIDNLFKTGSDTIISIQSKITDLQNELHLGQLIEKYLIDISKLQELVQVQIDQLEKTNESHLRIDYESTIEKRNSQHQNLVSEYKQASDEITDLKDIHNDVFTQYNTILTNDQSFNDITQENVSSKWDTLLSLESMVSALVSRSSKWVKHFNSLAIIRQDLESIQAKLTNDLIDEDYKQLDEKLNEIDTLLKGELFNLLDELIQDTINSKPFEIERKACLDLKEKLKLDLDNQITEKEKSILIQFIQSAVTRLCQECQVQIDLSNEHISTIVFDDKNDIQTTIDACSNIINKNNSIYSSIHNEIDSLRLNQCHELETKLNCTEQQINQFIDPISTNLNQLDGFTQSEKECLLLANLVSQYSISERSLLDTIDNYSLKMDTIEQDTLSYLETQLESLDENKKELVTIGETIHTFEFKHLLQSEIRLNNVSSTIQKSQDMMNNKYDEFMVKLENARSNMDEIKKRQQIILKLNDLVSFIADMTERVQLTSSNSNESEFEEMCQDFNQSLTKKTKVKDNLISSFELAQQDEEIQQLEQRLSNDLDALTILISIKKKQASDEGDLTEFLHIMNEFEEQIMIVLAAIENASPHHSGIVNNKFIKSDLQALLKSLVSTYKQNQISINKTLDRAQLESKKQFLGDNERVATLIQKANKKWTQVQAAAASRERELQTCIGKLDHEFFTKLAMAKTTPKRSRHVLPPAAQPVKRPTPTRYLNTVPRRSVDETNKKSSKTPISASSSASRLSRPSYVPDPRNALDIELSHIVNASPYPITVKIVPDQVGKYWFGDENPRLVYCRILPSQLVMVRVGGGWVELSKFLREHGLTEGVSSRPSSSNDNDTHHQETAPFQEGYLQTFRSSSPTGRITIRGGGAGGNSSSLASTRSSSKSSGSRSRSPLPGFVDGDKYISVDEAGNHVVVKMKKANNDAKMPIIKKKQ